MPKYIVYRETCETLEVEADSEEQAEEIAEETHEGWECDMPTKYSVEEVDDV